MQAAQAVICSWNRIFLPADSFVKNSSLEICFQHPTYQHMELKLTNFWWSNEHVGLRTNMCLEEFLVICESIYLEPLATVFIRMQIWVGKC